MASESQRRGASPGVMGLARVLVDHSDIALAAVVMTILMMIVMPLPPAMVDLMVASNIALAITILLISMYAKDVLSFSVFPSLLLLVTEPPRV